MAPPAPLCDELDRLLDETPEQAEARERSAFDRTVEECGGGVVLFGAGNLGRQAAKCLRKSGPEPLCFADNRQELWGRRVEGLEVVSPAEASRAHGRDSLFVVTIWNDRHRFADTRAQLEALGCKKVLPAAPLRWRFPDALLPALWEELPHRLLEQGERVREGLWLWDDERSQREYVGHVRWRLHADPEKLPPPTGEESYFPELFLLSPEEFFVDCGAYDGDTLRQFLRRAGPRFRRALALEPDPDLFDRLSRWVANARPEVRERIDAVPVATGAVRQRVRFDLATSAFSETGGIPVNVVPLDELLADEKPTFIKMDIEGAEADTLVGARNVLERHLPALAVCVYHRPADLWHIPQLIKEIRADYRLFLRSYDPDGWQTVCYAVPPGRLTPLPVSSAA